MMAVLVLQLAVDFNAFMSSVGIRNYLFFANSAGVVLTQDMLNFASLKLRIH